MRTEKLIKITREHAEAVYNIAKDKYNREHQEFLRKRKGRAK